MAATEKQKAWNYRGPQDERERRREQTAAENRRQYAALETFAMQASRQRLRRLAEGQ